MDRNAPRVYEEYYEYDYNELPHSLLELRRIGQSPDYYYYYADADEYYPYHLERQSGDIWMVY